MLLSSNLIYSIIRNQPTSLCLLQILRFQAHYYPSALAGFTHNSAGVPIIITCTKADMIDDGNDMVAGTSGMGSMVKGKGGEWKEQMGLCESFKRSA